MCDNIKVAIKVRPLNRREKDAGLISQWRIKENTIASMDPNSFSEPYCFDHIFDDEKNTQSLFEIVAKPIIQNCMKGINGTIFAYGQTSSGKTHTMTGTDVEMGLIPLSIHQIFTEIESMAPERQFLLRIAYIEIYNEKIFDLLDGKLSELKIRDTQNSGEAKVQCHEILVNSPEKILHYLAEGNAAKRMEETKMNERSSRSHTIFRITIESRAKPSGTEHEEGVVQISNLNLVDLAGSEKADQTGTTGARLKEGAYINRSLFSLGFVIKQLSEKGPETFINYRDSKLTRILQASLGGNSMTSIICTITPATVEETNYTLLFAMRAKTIKNKPIINETVSEATVMRRLEKEISRLKQQLQVEQRKNSKYRVEELQRDITERETKFVGSYMVQPTDKSRRRTWCPSSTHVNELSVVYEEKETGSKPSTELIPYINSERKFISTPFDNLNDIESLDDMFAQPYDDISVGGHTDRSLSPSCINTPLAFKSSRNRSYAQCEENCQCERLERELNDLKEFTRLEKKCDSKCTDLPQEYQELKEKLLQKDTQLEILSSRNSEFELQISRLDVKLQSLSQMEKDLNEVLKLKEVADQAKICAEYEYDQLKKRSISREKELTELINDFQNNEDNSKIVDRIKGLEVAIQEMEIGKEQLQSDIAAEKSKYDTLEKINSQLITDLVHEKEKLQNYMTETNQSLSNELLNTKTDLERKIMEFENLMIKNQELSNELVNEKLKMENLAKENLVLSNELENNRNALLIKEEKRNDECEKCVDLIENLEKESVRYGKLKKDFDSMVSSDLQEIESVALTLQHFLKSLSSDEANGKDNKNICDYLKDLKTICSSTSYVLTEKYNSNLNQSIEEFNAADLDIKNSSFIMSARDEVVIETLQNRTIDVENQIMKISNQLNKEMDTKAIQTEWRFEEFIEVNAKYTALHSNYTKLQGEYDEISTGIMDWIQENEELKKHLTQEEGKFSDLFEKYKTLLLEKQTLQEHRELSSLCVNYEEALKFNQSFQENVNDFSTLKAKYDILLEEKSTLEQQLDKMKAEIELLHCIESKYAQLLTDKDSLEQKFDEHLKNTDSVRESIEIMETSISGSITDEKSLNDSINELNLIQLKYNDLIFENQSVLDKCAKLDETNKKLIHSLESVTDENTTLKNSLSETTSNREVLAVKCSELEKHKNFLSAKYMLLIEEYYQLSNLVTVYEHKLDTLENETLTLKESMVEFEIIQEQYDRLVAGKSCTNSIGNDSETSVSNAKTLVDEMELLSDKFETVLNERDAVKARYEVLNTQYNATVASLEENLIELNSVHQKYEELLAEKDKLQKSFIQLEEQMGYNVEQLMESKNIIANYEDQLREITFKQIKYNELEQELQDLVTKIEELTAQQISPELHAGLLAENKKLTNTLTDLHSERKALIDEIANLKEELRTLTQNYTTIVEEQSESEKLLNESRETEKLLNTNISSLTDCLHSLQRKHNELEQVFESSLGNSSEFQKKYSAILIEKQILEKQIKDLTTEKINYEEMVQKLRYENEQKLLDMQAKHEDLQNTAKKAEDNHYHLLATIQEIEESKKGLEAQLRSELKANEQKYENKLANSVKELNDCKWNLNCLEQKYEELQRTHIEVEENPISEFEILRQGFELKCNDLEQSKSVVEAELESIIQKCLEFQKLEENLKSEIKTLEIEKTDLQNSFLEKAAIEENLNSQLNSIKHEFEVLQNTLNDMQDDKSSIKEDLSSQLTALKQKYDELEENKSVMEKSLKTQLNSTQQEFESLKLTIKELQDEKTSIEAHLTIELSSLNKKYVSLEESRSTMEKHLKSELNSGQQKYEALQKANKELQEGQSDLTSLHKKYDVLQAAFDELYAAKTTMEKNLNSVQDKYETLQKTSANELEKSLSDLVAVRKEYAVLQSACAALEKSKYTLDVNLSAAQEKYEALQKFAKEWEQSKSELITLQKKYVVLQSAFDELNAIKSTLETNLNFVQGKYETHQKNIKEMEKRQYVLHTLQKKYDDLQLAYVELETAKSMLEKNLNSVQQSSDRVQITVKILEQNKFAVEQKCHQLQTDFNKLKEQHTLLLGKSSELEKTIALLESENKLVKQTKLGLEMQVITQTEKIFSISSRLAESETKQNQLKAEHAALERKSKSLQSELDALKSNSKSAVNSSDELKDRSKRIDTLEHKKQELLAQLHELQNMHIFKTGQLESEVLALNKKVEESNVKLMQMQKNSNMSKNKLLNENSELKKKNQTLFFELDDIKRKQNDRKSRRSITYDSNRSTLMDVQTIGTMTDKTDSNCNCDIMNDKIKELARQNYIKDCHITNYKIKEKNNPLIMECCELREKLTASENNVIELERQLIQVNVKLRKYREKTTCNNYLQAAKQLQNKSIGTNTDARRSSPIKQHKYEESTVAKKKHVQIKDRLIQTEAIVNFNSKDELHSSVRQLELEVNRLRMRYEESKSLAIARRRKIEILNDQLTKLQRA